MISKLDLSPLPRMQSWQIKVYKGLPTLKVFRNPKGKDRLPTTIFQGRTVKLRGLILLMYPGGDEPASWGPGVDPMDDGVTHSRKGSYPRPIVHQLLVNYFFWDGIGET